MRFAILGPIELRDGERRTAIGSAQQVTLLAFLVLHRNRAVSIDQIHHALWTRRGHDGAAKRVQMAVLRLREGLERGAACGRALRTVGGGYVLDVAAGELDADLFEARLTEGRELLDGGDAEAASGVLRDALGLWRGPALAQVAFEDFAHPEIRRLGELHLAALEARVEADLALGRHATVIGELRARVAEHPARERLHGQLMLALYRCGRQSDALDAYQQLSTHLNGELGLSPGPALQALQRAVLEQAAWLDVAAAPAPTPRSSPDPRAAAEEEAFPLPPAVAPAERGPFVGRAAPSAQLAAAYERAAGGARQLVVLSGEPGIGKTRLVTELAHDAHAAGAVVLYGRCDEEPLLPYQPFVEALRHYVRHCPARLLASRVKLISGELRRVVPELAERVPELSQPLAGDADGARHRLFEALAAFLSETAREQPAVLVLDDLQWADDATLLLLKYVARYPSDARLMVVGTYRDTDIDDAHPLSSVLVALEREQLLERVPLARLDEGAVSELVGWHTGEHAPADLRRMVFEETQGLAFFVVEISRHLSDSAGDPAQTDRATSRITLPDNVKDLIRRRLARLGPETSRALATAAVLGSSFAFDTLQRVCNGGEDELLDALDRAVGAQLVVEPVEGEARYAFSHALIRDVLYSSLGHTRRRLLHRRAAATIQAANAGGELPFAELAHHLECAGAPEDLRGALHFESRAADKALASLAYEQAAERLRRALDLLARSGEATPSARCDLMTTLGEAERKAGVAGHRDTLLQAANVALELGDGARAARAGLGNDRGFNSSYQGVDPELIAVLESARALLGDDDEATHARILGRLAQELVADDDWQRRAQLSDAALEIARRVGDPATLAQVLTQHTIAQWRPDTLAMRTAHLRESLLLAEAAGARQLRAHAASIGYHTALESGDLARSEELLAQLTADAQELRQPLFEWFEAVARAKRCAVVGSPHEAERLGFRVYEIGQRAGQPDAVLWLLSHLYVARLLRGTLDEGEPNLPALFATPGSSPITGPEFTPGRTVPLLVSASMSAVLCEIGRPAEARTHFDLVMAQLSDLPTDYSTLVILASSAIACAHLRDATMANRLDALLEPYSGQFVDAGASWLGAVVHHRAVLQAAMSRFDDADELFGAAQRAYTGLASAAWLARCRLDWASMLLERGSGDDTERASALAAGALATAHELDMRKVAERATGLLALAGTRV